MLARGIPKSKIKFIRKIRLSSETNLKNDPVEVSNIC